MQIVLNYYAISIQFKISKRKNSNKIIRCQDLKQIKVII